MPIPEDKLENKKADDTKPAAPKKGLNSKVLLIGVPIFILELIIVYFVTANILLKKIESRDLKSGNKPKGKQVKNVKENSSVELGKYIYSIKDIIVNPADTDGKRLLLTSVGFDVPKSTMEEELKTRVAMVKDAVISTLSSKDISQLINITYRDSLKSEIAGKLKKLIPEIKINKVYFSKYIIQ